MVSQLVGTMWYHMDGCAKQYRCASAIYLLSCIALKFSIINNRPVGAPGHGKYSVYGLNSGDKLMLKLETEKLLNPELV